MDESSIPHNGRKHRKLADFYVQYRGYPGFLIVFKLGKRLNWGCEIGVDQLIIPNSRFFQARGKNLRNLRNLWITGLFF